MIFIGADHRGYEKKEKLKKHLKDRGYQITDLGTHNEDPIDYPLIAEKVARKVIEDPYNRGILICGSGAGVCIVANKVDKIRAAEAWIPEVARAARYDDNVNVLCLASDHLEFEEMKPIAQTFIDTSFGGEDRYNRRLEEIEELEKDN